MLCNNYRPKLKLDELSKEVFDGMNKTERANCVFKEGRELLCRENPNYVISPVSRQRFLCGGLVHTELAKN